jgi:hypothetical protein
MENLERLTSEEWPLLQSRVSHEDWSLALAEGPAGVTKALLANLPERARKVLEQMIAARPGDEESRRAAQDKVSRAVAALTAEGRLGDLAARAAAAMAPLTAKSRHIERHAGVLPTVHPEGQDSKEDSHG